jgi:hypothetical protein
MRHQSSREQGLNIRILRFSESELMDKANKYRFFIAPAYSQNDKNVPAINIAYCPFCGTNLFEFYNDDIYVNETYKDFLYP